MAKTIPISASRAGLGSVIVVDSTGIVKTQALSASRAGAGGSVFSVDDGTGKTYSQSGIGVAVASNDLSLNKNWFIANVGVESAGSGAVAVAIPALLPALVADADAFYAPGIVNILQFLQPALVTDDDAFSAPTVAFPVQQTLLPALVTDSDSFPAPAIGTQYLASALWTDPTIFYMPAMGWGVLPPLYTDQDIFYAAGTAFPLLPALVTDSDSFPVPAIGIGTSTLFPPLVADADVFFSLFVTLVGLPGGPLQKLKPPPKLQDNDVIFAPRMSVVTGVVIDVDAVRTPVVTALSLIQPQFVLAMDDAIPAVTANVYNRLQPALLPSDDAVYTPLITMILQPALVVSGDGILATDVGWKLFGQLLIDVEFFPGTGIRSYNELLPEVWKDEETIDTYPFFLQQVAGGIPVLPREGVLTGSIKQTVKLTGSITKRRLVA